MALSTISVRAKKEGWVKGKIEGSKDKKINAIKKLKEVEDEIEGLEPKEIASFDNLVTHELEMQGLYNSFEKLLVNKAVEQLSKHKPKAEDAVDSVVKLTTAIKNIKPPQPSTVIKNTVNTANMSLDERKQELMNKLKAYDCLIPKMKG